MSSIREKYRKIMKKKEEQVKVRKLKRKKIYVKAKCQFHDNGIRCTRLAIGKGQTCAQHGGAKDLTNTLSPEATKLYLVEKGKSIKFNPGIHPLQMIDLSRQGLSVVEVAAEMGVGANTLARWADTYQAFAVAHDIGKALYESWWLQKGKAGLDSRNFNTTLFKFLTGNKLGYADKIETKNLNMNACGVLVVPPKQSMDEWEASSVDAKVE